MSAAEALPELLTVEEVAALLRVHRNTVYQLLADKKIPGIVKVGRAVRANKAIVLAWIASGDQRDSRARRTP